MSHIPNINWINVSSSDIINRCNIDVKNAEELRIAALAAQTKGLHYMLNELNVIKNLQTWLDMLIVMAPNSVSKATAIEQKLRVDTYVDDRYSDLWLYDLVSLFCASTQKDGRKTLNRALVNEAMVFRLAGIELDPDGKQKVKSLKESIRNLEKQQICTINTAINSEGGEGGKSIENTADAYKKHYLSFVSNIPNKPLLQLIIHRHELAVMLDFSCYAAMAQIHTLAQHPDAVAHVLTEITPEFDYSFSDEARALLALNKGKPIHAWELGILENTLAQRYAPVIPPILSTESVIALALKLTFELGIILKPGLLSWHSSVKHWACLNGDIYIQQSVEAKTWQVIPMIHRLTTFGEDMDIIASTRPHILVRGPQYPFTTESIESFLMQWGRAMRYLLIGSGVASLLEAEAEATDLTGYILIEMFWDERNMQTLEIEPKKQISKSVNDVNSINSAKIIPMRLPIEKIRYLKRRKDLLVGLQSKIELLHCKFDLVIHSNLTLLKNLAECTSADGIIQLNALQTRLWQDNMCCKNQSKFLIVSPPELEAACWRELYDTPGLRYSEIWGKLLAADMYQNCIRAGSSKKYAERILRFGAMAPTDRIIYKLIGRHPNYDAYYELHVHLLRSYYDRDDDETSEQVDSSKLMQVKNCK